MVFVQSDAVPPMPVLADSIRLLLRSAQSPGQMSVMLVDVPPGSGVPLHSHVVEEEGYFILSGTLTMTVGGETRRLEPGGFAHVPPGVRHGYANIGDGLVSFLAWTIGGPVDRFFEQMSREVRRMPDDAPHMAQACLRFGVVLEEAGA